MYLIFSQPPFRVKRTLDAAERSGKGASLQECNATLSSSMIPMRQTVPPTEAWIMGSVPKFAHGDCERIGTSTGWVWRQFSSGDLPGGLEKFTGLSPSDRHGR